MISPMQTLFAKPLPECAIVTVDFETTGLRPGIDRVVQVGLARFESGKCVGSIGSLISTDMAIPPEATLIHGIDNAMTDDAPELDDFFHGDHVKALLQDAQPAAFNAPFDRLFIPPWALADYTWPWLDVLSVVRVIDRYERGKGRHKLPACCERHGVTLTQAHSAEADAVAAGELLFKLITKIPDMPADLSLGRFLRWQMKQEAEEFFRFQTWSSEQPPLENSTNGDNSQ